MITCVIGTALTILLVTPFARAATTSQPATAIFRGINADPVYEFKSEGGKSQNDLAHFSRALTASHTQAVRIPIRWIVAEAEKGKRDWTRIDRAIAAVPADVEILGLLLSVPPWASGVDPAKCVGWPDTYAPRDLHDWENFVRRAVARYQARITHWEIWNEENGIDFFHPAPDASQYVAILKSAFLAAKETDPRCQIVLGGLQMNGVIANPWSPVKVPDFLDQIYRAGGREFFDICNTHPYVMPADGAQHMIDLTRDTRKVMARYGDDSKPLWLTEFGCSLTKETTAEAQARFLTEAYALASKEQGIDRLYWFTLRDFQQDQLGGEASMGLFKFDWTPKPAFQAFERLPR